MLMKIESILKLFYVTTKYLKGNVINESHDTLLKLVFKLKCPIQSL